MKSFHLFWGENYYPMGGAYDYRGSYQSLDEASDALPDHRGEWFSGWAQVAQTQQDGSLKIVAHWRWDTRKGYDRAYWRSIPLEKLGPYTQAPA